MEKLINCLENLGTFFLLVFFREFQFFLQIHTEFLVQEVQNSKELGIKKWGLLLPKLYRKGKI